MGLAFANFGVRAADLRMRLTDKGFLFGRGVGPVQGPVMGAERSHAARVARRLPVTGGNAVVMNEIGSVTGPAKVDSASSGRGRISGWAGEAVIAEGCVRFRVSAGDARRQASRGCFLRCTIRASPLRPGDTVLRVDAVAS